MSITPPTVSTTLEPAKRIFRTVIVIVLGILSILGYVIGHVHFTSPTLILIAGQVTGVSIVLTGFFATPAGNWLLSWINLDATAVAKVKTDSNQLAADVTPVALAAAAAVKAPTVANFETVANATLVAEPTAVTDAETAAGDVTAAGK